MPIYEYRCNDCGHQLEKLQKMSDPELVDCPVCSKPSLTKMMSAAGFQLKGSGWYQTDFRGSKPSEKKTDETASGGCGAPQCATACAGGTTD